MEESRFFSINLNRIMSEKGLTIEKVAEKSEVSWHTVFRASSKGVIPRGPNIAKIAHALGVSSSDLLKDPNQPKNTRLQDLANPEKTAEIMAEIFAKRLEEKEISELRAELDKAKDRIKALESRDPKIELKMTEQLILSHFAALSQVGLERDGILALKSLLAGHEADLKRREARIKANGPLKSPKGNKKLG